MNIQRLKEIREDKDLKQSDVAKALGIKQQQYSEYEIGKRLIPINYLYELAIEYDNNYDIAYNNLGVIYLDDLGRVQKAIELFKKSIECNPNYALAHFNLARAITITGDKIEAAKLYQIAQDINKVTNEMDPQEIIDKINALFN